MFHCYWTPNVRDALDGVSSLASVRERTMLDGLQTVPWYDLHAATGTAEEVPDLLRRLADEDLQQRSDALEHLRELIYHQTSLYAASSASVPFLIELATQARRRSGVRNLQRALVAPPLDHRAVQRPARRGDPG